MPVSETADEGTKGCLAQVNIVSYRSEGDAKLLGTAIASLDARVFLIIDFYHSLPNKKLHIIIIIIRC